jgi:hypothetical protein
VPPESTRHFSISVHLQSNEVGGFYIIWSIYKDGHQLCHGGARGKTDTVEQAMERASAAVTFLRQRNWKSYGFAEHIRNLLAEGETKP